MDFICQNCWKSYKSRKTTMEQWNEFVNDYKMGRIKAA